MKSTKELIYAALCVSLCVVGSLLIRFGVSTVGLDAAPAFVASLILGPRIGAIVGALGHMFNALLVGFPLNLPVHIVIAFVMAGTMYAYGWMFQWMTKKYPRASLIKKLGVCGMVGYICNVCIGLLVTYVALMVLMGTTWSLEAFSSMFVVLSIGCLANIIIASMVYMFLPSQ